MANATPAGVDFGNMSMEQLKALVEKQAAENAALKASKGGGGGGGAGPSAQVKVAVPTTDPKTKALVKNDDGSQKMTGGKLAIYGVTGRFPVTLRDGTQINRLFNPKHVLAFIEAGIRDEANFLFEGSPEEIAAAKTETREVLVALRKQYQAIVKG